MPDIEKQITDGSVLNVNKDAKVVQVKSGSSEVSLGIDEDTTITVNGYYRVVADLAPGQKIRKIYYTEKGGRKMATIVHVIDEKLLEIQKKKKGPAEKEERKPAI